VALNDAGLSVSDINVFYFTSQHAALYRSTHSDRFVRVHVFTWLFTEELLESLVEDLVTRSIEPLKVALNDAGLSVSDINDVTSQHAALYRSTHSDRFVRVHVFTWLFTEELRHFRTLK
jgi:hypothetical protein